LATTAAVAIDKHLESTGVGKLPWRASAREFFKELMDENAFFA
jgi:hypothetical protein